MLQLQETLEFLQTAYSGPYKDYWAAVDKSSVFRMLAGKENGVHTLEESV